jgi:hypothetical protein
MTNRQRSIAVAIAVAICAVLFSRGAVSQTQTAADQPGLCELRIEGQSIRQLTLLRDDPQLGQNAENLSAQTFDRPGQNLSLPAGRYRVANVQLEEGYQCGVDYARTNEWFELKPGTPYQLVVGAPLFPQVTVTRHGKFLEMDCELVDGSGRIYSWSNQLVTRPAPPWFTVYKDDKVIGSGSFEYG